MTSKINIGVERSAVLASDNLDSAASNTGGKRVTREGSTARLGNGQDLSQDDRGFILKRIETGRIETTPYPHFCVGGIFPRKFYKNLLEHKLPLEAYNKITDTTRVRYTGDDSPYANRYQLNPNELSGSEFERSEIAIWRELGAWLTGREFITALLTKFAPYLRSRFGAQLATTDFASDVQVIRDFTGYKLGPHTDAEHKVAVMIVYLPETSKDQKLGTSIYEPLAEGFRCAGGPHYPHDKFRRVKTIKYAPNSALFFLKTSNSFHGVEPVKKKGKERNLIQLSILYRQQQT